MSDPESRRLTMCEPGATKLGFVQPVHPPAE